MSVNCALEARLESVYVQRKKLNPNCNKRCHHLSYNFFRCWS